MESLAFNIMARIDDLTFVDDSTNKRAAAADEVSVFNRGRLGGLPVQKRISPSPFSIQNTPHASPFSTPFSSSTPINGSSPVRRAQPHLPHIREKEFDVDRVWSYAGNLSARKDLGQAPERD